jgi:hypothetical protein
MATVVGCCRFPEFCVVGTVVVLTTSQTTTTGMLAVLAYTSMSVGDVAATMGFLVSL